MPRQLDDSRHVVVVFVLLQNAENMRRGVNVKGKTVVFLNFHFDFLSHSHVFHCCWAVFNASFTMLRFFSRISRKMRNDEKVRFRRSFSGGPFAALSVGY